MEVAQHRTAQKTHSKPHLTLRKIQDLISSNTADFCVLRCVWKTATLKRKIWRNCSKLWKARNN